MLDYVSIVIPVYNVIDYLDNCVNSVLHQTYEKIEIILVDDGSTDGSGERCEYWKTKDSRIVVLHKENGGLSSARNYGIDIVKNKYICFVDSDDSIDENYVRDMINEMRKEDADIVICNRYHVFVDEKKYLRFKNSSESIVMDSETAILEMNSYRYFDMSACGRLYKTNLFSEIRFPVGKISEDFFIMYLLFDKADKIIYLPKALYLYTQRLGSITKQKKLNMDFVEAANEQMLYVEKKYPQLKACMHGAFASANMTAYNGVLTNKSLCSKDELSQMRRSVKENIKYVYGLDTWSLIKKIQCYLFVYSLKLYNISYKLYKRIKHV